jgi:hypothetical protein
MNRDHVHVHLPPAEPPVPEDCLPAPTPPRVPSWVTDLAKWGSLDRATRRRLIRHHEREARKLR